MRTFFPIALLFISSLVSGQAKKPFILGGIEEIQSVELSETRILNIYFPEGYNENDTISYPVIYLLDGSANEDFIHIAGLVQFSNFEWVNILPKSILVGIANVDRKRDFTFPTTVAQDKKDFPTTGGSGKFIRFIENELLPFIEKKYRTTTSKTIIGQSLGGLLATEILFGKPDLFSKYIIVSPSLWWDNESLLNKGKAFSERTLTKPVSVYVGVGNEEKIMVNDAKKLTETVKANKNTSVFFEFFEKENHATILHQAVYNAFEKLRKK